MNLLISISYIPSDELDLYPFLMKLASPEVQDMLTRIVAAGEAARDWFVALSRAARATAATVGIPGLSGGTAKAPYRRPRRYDARDARRDA